MISNYFVEIFLLTLLEETETIICDQFLLLLLSVDDSKSKVLSRISGTAIVVQDVQKAFTIEICKFIPENGQNSKEHLFLVTLYRFMSSNYKTTLIQQTLGQTFHQ